MGFLKFTHALARLANAVQNFISQHRFRILKFVPGCVHYAHIAQNFASQCEFKILKFIHEPPHALRHALTRAPRRILPRTDKAEVGRAARLTSQHTYDAVEKRHAVKLNQYLNSVRRRIVRLRSAAARHGHEVGSEENFSKFDLTGALLNFISLPSHKFKPASIPLLNFISNFTPHARASKFENGVKFKAAAKFKRGAR